jgi:hypothetical protein
MPMPIPNRIKGHRRVKASDLIPNEGNIRVHNDAQRDALKALYEEIGFARSLLAYETQDGKLKLIDGHLRQSLDPDMEVEVEILDVTDDEAKRLLLSIDPLAQLADFDSEAVERLKAQVSSPSDALNNLWNSIANAQEAVKATLANANAQAQAKAKEQERTRSRADPKPISQYLVIVECKDEKAQIDLLMQLRREGQTCRAVLS